ncbi:hypothetical protein OSTOST_09846, partial [Ostertagia ostertagi]
FLLQIVHRTPRAASESEILFLELLVPVTFRLPYNIVFRINFLDQFLPLGLSSYYSKGRISLYVVNTHPNRQCVEIFTYHKEKNVLFHRKSVCDAGFS